MVKMALFPGELHFLAQTGNIKGLNEVLNSSRIDKESKSHCFVLLPAAVKSAVEQERDDVYDMINGLRGSEHLSDETVRMLFTYAKLLEGHQKGALVLSDEDRSKLSGDVFRLVWEDLKRFGVLPPPLTERSLRGTENPDYEFQMFTLRQIQKINAGDITDKDHMDAIERFGTMLVKRMRSRSQKRDTGEKALHSKRKILSK